MADLRVLKLALLAETKDFIKGLDDAEKNTKTFSQKLGKAVQSAALAFGALALAAGGAAIKIGKDAVKAAIEDEASQAQLARALKNTTNATDGQIKSTEEYITKIQNQTGLQDTDLRKSFGSLIRVTKDSTKAQELQTIAIDIAAATGKDLDSVTQAVSRAYGGNLTALQKLDPSLKAVIEDGATIDEVFDSLSKTFGGSAADAADTFAGKMEIIKRRTEDAQEAIGFALLPVMEKISNFIGENVVPAFEGLVRGLTGGDRSVRGATKETNSAFADMGIVIDDNDSAAYDLGEALRDLAGSIRDLFVTAEEGSKEESGLVRFIKLLERIVDATDRMIERIDAAKIKIAELSDAASRGLGVIGLQAPLAATERAGERFRERVGTMNVVIRGNPDPQRAGRDIIKVVNKNTATTGVRFVGIPGR
jgi:hypothetical protein